MKTKLFHFLAMAMLLGACGNKNDKIHCRIKGTDAKQVVVLNSLKKGTFFQRF